ncbi:hypothetical protein [Herbaspirillum autotrophicum]|uniref:hypothetical protein n=1 Tax=Herbaspirillum autotrophicum TaxID=180195 RepID=UPI000A5074E4|nr:hypothetical protein [Herbaspirillum autotrophicum]
MRTGLALLLVVICGGCADLTTFHRVDSSGGGVQVIAMDAKQRVLISSPYVEEIPIQRKTINQATQAEEIQTVTLTKRYQRFCAEPSPDALSALAASLGIDLSVAGKGDLGVKQAFSEGAATIGIRTSAIQALRDITYRDCEAHMNGGITKFGLETLQRRFQSTLVAVLAIEQLSGAVRSPNVILNAQTSGNDAESLSKISDQTATAKSALETAKSAQTSADEKLVTASAAQKSLETKIAADKDNMEKLDKKSADSQSETEKADLANFKKLQADLDTAKKNTTAATEQSKKAATSTQDKQAEYDAQVKIRNAALTAAGSTSINSQLAQIPVMSMMDKDTVKALSEAIENIVTATLGLGFGRETCTTVFGYIAERDNILTTPASNSLALKCIDYLSEDIASAKAYSALVTAQAKFVSQLADNMETLIKGNKLSDDVVKNVLKPPKLQYPFSAKRELNLPAPSQAQ